MALPNISFWPVNDIHLLRGQSIDLLRLLYVGEDPARVFRSAHHGVAYSFAPFFKKESGGATIHTGLNITVNTVTGTLTTQRAPPAVEKRNFLVKAIAQLAGEERITYVRVHIHQSIEDAWLTPNVLTVHEGIKGFKFSIRVLFDDHVMAEIGEVSDGSEMTNHGLYSISWSHPVHGLVDRDSGEIDPTVLNIKGLIADEITAHISDASVGTPGRQKEKYLSTISSPVTVPISLPHYWQAAILLVSRGRNEIPTFSLFRMDGQRETALFLIRPLTIMSLI